MRVAEVKRETLETIIEVDLNLDGSGQNNLRTGVVFLNHLLGATSRHGLIDLKVRAESQTERDAHHLIEDIGITLGQAISLALGDRKGIRRFGSALVPMDEAIAEVSLDISGRGYLVFEAEPPSGSTQNVDLEMIRHFLQSVSFNGKFTLHVTRLHGRDYHHMAEALFKALGIALRQAVELDPRLGEHVPSQKGVIDRG